MTIFHSLDDTATVPDILAIEPVAGIALTQLTHTVMRGPSPLSEELREVIATYVSGLNKCTYCYGIHAACAVAYGFPKRVMDTWYDDLNACGLDAKRIVLLNVARTLTKDPSAMTEALARTVYDAGWDERALHDTISVIGVFNLYNRFVEGHHVKGNLAMYAERGPMLKDHGYTPLIRMLERQIQKNTVE